MEPKKYRLPMSRLDSRLLVHIDKLMDAREKRDNQLRALGVGAGTVVALAKAAPLLLAVGSPGVATGTAKILRKLREREKEVMGLTRMIGNEISRHSTEVLPPGVTARILRERFTHAHVDGKGNLVFTREPRPYRGKEIVPHPLKPATWAWRMKVPLRKLLIGRRHA